MKKAILFLSAMILFACAFFTPQKAQAQDPFIGEIRIFAGNFAPRGWAFCNGQLLLIEQNMALYSILGTIYGGDGRTTFGLPDLRGRVVIHSNNSIGGIFPQLGSTGGEEQTALEMSHLPSHTHQARGSSGVPDSVSPEDNVPAAKIRTNLYSTSAADVDMGESVISSIGGNQAHNNMQPYLCLNYIIALQGTFPSRP